MAEQVYSQAPEGEVANKEGLIELLVAERVPIRVDVNGVVWVKKDFYDLLEGAKIEAEGEYYKLVEIPEGDMTEVFGLGAETPRCPPPF